MKAFAWLAAAVVAVFYSCTSALAQSPFYLTFERSFSTREETKLRFDYMNAEDPIHVRVLRPKDLNRFLEGQLNISRSYEEPRAALNPGHYLANGINSMRSPTVAFQRLLSPEFRSAWTDSLSPSLKVTGSQKLVTPPKLITHEPPVGFEIASDMYVDLRLGGSEPQDVWWWFFDQSAEAGSSYSVRTVSLGTLPAGLFLVQAVQGDNEAQALLQVSELSMQVKQSSSELAVRCVDRDGKPMQGVAISVRDGKGAWQELAERSDVNGSILHRHTAGLDSRLIVKAVTPSGESAFSDTDFLELRATPSNMLLLTDRPIFRPGDEVHFKGILRTTKAGELSTANAEISSALLLRQDGSEAGRMDDLKSTEFGSVSGSFTVSQYDTPGLYSVVTDVGTTPGNEPYAGELRVRDYVKPTFYLELISHAGQLRAGEKFSYKLRARRYAGGAPQGAKYEVFAYRKKFEVPQFVEDSGSALATGSDYFGNVTSTSGVSTSQKVYSSLDVRLSDEDKGVVTESWASASTFDANGEAEGEITIPPIQGDKQDEEWTYSIVFRAMDREGSFAVASEPFYQTLSEGVIASRFSKVVAKPGESGVRFNTRVTSPEGLPLPGVEGTVEFKVHSADGREVKSTKSFVTNQNGYGVIECEPFSQIGVVEARSVATGTKDKRWTHPAQGEKVELLVIGGSGEAIRASKEVLLYSDTTVVSPGEKVSVYALLPDAWGVSNSGPVWRTIASDKIHSVEAITGKGRSLVYQSEAKAEFGTGYFETLTVPVTGGKFQEATLGLRIVPWKKRLKINVIPEKEVGEPLEPFGLRALVTDADGKPASNVEVSLGVVDRAVYAVQPEFRPGLLDFFFPMPRLNLMTFYSDELQGYGYAAEVKKPNFSLTAIKSQTKLSKRSLRDTAGWFPHLVTNDAGEVSVTLDMPGNLTEWLVTATAIDKNGRLGEGNGRFRTAVDIEAEPRAPQFLRSGDSVVMPVAIRNQTDTPVAVSVAGTASQGSTEVGLLPEESTKVAAKGLEIRTLDVKAAGTDEELLIALTANADDPALKLGGVREFEMPVKKAAFGTTVHGGAAGVTAVTLNIPEKAWPQKLSVTATAGLLGLVLTKAKDLVTYPYGCAEQLAHTIMPNLALLELVKAVPELADKGGEFEPLIRKARANVDAGFRKLGAYQKANGGFSLWPNDPEPSPMITMLVLSVLQKGEELEISGVSRRRWNAVSWLEGAAKTEWSPYELFILAEKNLDNGRSDTRAQMVTLVREALDKPDMSFGKLVYAAGIATHYAEISWHAFNQELNDPQASEKLLNKLVTFVETSDISNVSYDSALFTTESLGFAPGSTSLLADALRVLVGGIRGSTDAATLLKKRIVSDLRDGQVWSPLDVAYVVEGVMPTVLEEMAESATKSETVQVLDNNKAVLGTLKKIRGGYAGQLDVQGVPVSKLASISVSGATSEWFSFASLGIDLPFDGLAARSNGVSVKRSLYKVVGKGAQPFADDAELSIGDVVVSKIEVSRSESTSTQAVQPSEWLVVQDSVPATAEPIDDDKPYLADAGMAPQESTFWSAIRETLRYPDRIERVVRLLPGASFTSYSVWRVGFAGNAVVGPAHAFDMYSRNGEGFSASTRITSKSP